VEADQAGMYPMENGFAPGEYLFVAVADLPEGDRRDPAIAARYATEAKTVRLGERESRTSDLVPLRRR